MAEPCILRVFPRRTSYTPDDPLAFVGYPPLPLFLPDADEVHISVTWTWDLMLADRLILAWAQFYSQIRYGGPAYGDGGGDFTPGLYVKPGITFTSRGCPRRCQFCFVPLRTHGLRLLDPVPEGWRISDDNFLATPTAHRRKVYAMLDRQPRGAEFSGGIDARLVTKNIAAEFRSIRIAEVFLACDTEAALRPLEMAVQHLQFLGRAKLRVYALVGYQDETIEQAEMRLRQIYEIGCLPFPQVYRGASETHRQRSHEWSALMKRWRPAAAKARAKLDWRRDYAI